jgi:hypothetical protein
MARRLVVSGVGLAITVVLLAVVVGVGLVTFGTPAAAAPVATLSVFTGSASLQRAGSTAAVAAHTGESVASGDSVATAAGSKAAVTYPDGSITRLDSLSKVTISMARVKGAGLKLGVSQSLGLTWNAVKKLVGASTFHVSGPNNANAEVRGTRFGFYIEKDPTGKPVIWIDTYDGIVAVSGAVGPPVTSTANQRVTVRVGAAPTAPVPIPDADRHLSFTVFNQTLEAVPGKAFAFRSGLLDTGQSAGPSTVTADGKSDLQLVLGWPGSIFELTVVDPSGKNYAKPAASQPPVVVTIPGAAAGTWTFSVRDVKSAPQEPWWVIAGR